MRKIYDLSEGAWDATVRPLVEWWGFGRIEKKPSIPSAAELRSLLTTVGFNKIEMTPIRALD